MLFCLFRKQETESSSDSGSDSDSDSDSELIGPPMPPQLTAQDDDELGPLTRASGSTAHIDEDDDDDEGEAQDDDDVCLK